MFGVISCANFCSDLFRLCPPSLAGAFYLHPPPDARVIFKHNDLLRNDKCSVTGGRITYWGGINGKDPFALSCDLLTDTKKITHIYELITIIAVPGGTC